MILDVLRNGTTVVGQDDLTVVDSSVALQVLVNPPGAGGLAFADGNGNTWFERGDNITLRRAQISTPFGFGQGEGAHYIGIAWKDSPADGGGFTTITELAGNSILPIPDFCTPLEFPPDGLLIRTPTTVAGTQRVELMLTNIVCPISMVGVPSVLVGQVLSFPYYLEIVHTRAMQGAAV